MVPAFFQFQTQFGMLLSANQLKTNLCKSADVCLPSMFFFTLAAVRQSLYHMPYSYVFQNPVCVRFVIRLEMHVDKAISQVYYENLKNS